MRENCSFDSHFVRALIFSMSQPCKEARISDKMRDVFSYVCSHYFSRVPIVRFHYVDRVLSALKQKISNVQ